MTRPLLFLLWLVIRCVAHEPFDYSAFPESSHLIDDDFGPTDDLIAKKRSKNERGSGEGYGYDISNENIAGSGVSLSEDVLDNFAGGSLSPHNEHRHLSACFVFQYEYYCGRDGYCIGVCTCNCCQCPVGEYESDSGFYSDIRSCSQCSGGRYQSEVGQTSCLLCPTGKYTSSMGQTNCHFCPAGTYAGSVGHQLCYSCPTGHYTSSTGQTGCLTCPAGRYQSSTGQTSCNSCSAGQYTSNTGRSVCNSCPPGQYQDIGEQTGCKSCPSGMYCPAGASEPLTPLPTTIPTPVPSSEPTLNPTPAPTSMPTPSPSLVPSPAPTPLPSIIPTGLPSFPPSPLPTNPPSLYPTPQPTVGLGALGLDEAALEVVVAMTTAAIGAAVVSTTLGASIGSIGAGAGSGAGAGAAGGGGGGFVEPSGNPLMLVFLVQGMFMTSLLSDAPAAYADLLGGFSVFNLEMAPPSWAKKVVLGAGRRLQSKSGWIFDDFFTDDSNTSDLMRAHLFHLCILLSLTLCIHKAVYVFFKCNGTPVPPVLRAPGVEVQLFLVLFMGMINVSLQVLMNGGTAPGWKMIGVIELSFVFVFFCFLENKATQFLQVTEWHPVANVRRLRFRDSWALMDTNHDKSITLDEMLSAAPRLGLTKVQAKNMFLNMDTNKSGTIDQQEFHEGFKGEMVAVELTTPVERFWAYFVSPRRPAGVYSPVDPKKIDLSDPWVAFFVGFTPSGVHFLALRIVAMVVEAFVLGGMHGWSQGLFLFLFSFSVMAIVLSSPTSVLLAQSRADSIDAVGKFLTYATYSLIFPKWITAGNAAQAMTVVNGLMLVHSLFTQLEPVLGNVLISITAFFWCFVKSVQPPGEEDGDEENPAVVDLGDLSSTEEAMSLLWQRLRAYVVSEGTVQAEFYKALKTTALLVSSEEARYRVTKGPTSARFKLLKDLDVTTFDDGLTHLNLKGMTPAMVAVLLRQCSVHGTLMSNKQLLQVLQEPKDSTVNSDEQLSRVERAWSRSLSTDVDSTTGLLKSGHQDQAGLKKQSSGFQTKKPSPMPTVDFASLPGRKSHDLEQTAPLESWPKKSFLQARKSSDADLSFCEELGEQEEFKEEDPNKLEEVIKTVSSVGSPTVSSSGSPTASCMAPPLLSSPNTRSGDLSTSGEENNEMDGEEQVSAKDLRTQPKKGKTKIPKTKIEFV